MYICIYVYVCNLQLAQCNSMLVFVPNNIYIQQQLCNTILAQCLCNNEVKMRPGVGATAGCLGQVRTASDNCKFWPLAAYIALTAALVRYGKDKGAFITARQRVIELTSSVVQELPTNHKQVVASGHCWPSAADEEWYSPKRPSSTVAVQTVVNSVQRGVLFWTNITNLFKSAFKLHCIYQVLRLPAS